MTTQSVASVRRVNANDDLALVAGSSKVGTGASFFISALPFQSVMLDEHVIFIHGDGCFHLLFFNLPSSVTLYSRLEQHVLPLHGLMSSLFRYNIIG